MEVERRGGHGEKLVEVAGVEPASYRASTKSSTSIVHFFVFADGVRSEPLHIGTPPKVSPPMVEGHGN